MFIPLVEKFGLMQDLTSRVLSCAIAESRPLIERYPGFTVAVNVSNSLMTDLMFPERIAGQLDTLTARERRVLELMAQGLSNSGIGRDLFVSDKTVETYVAAVHAKLGLSGGGADPARNRRVLAVLTYLRS